jgi:hypothetical protein
MHPYGQGNLGVMYSVQCKKYDMHNYVRRIGKYYLMHLTGIFYILYNY